MTMQQNWRNQGHHRTRFRGDRLPTDTRACARARGVALSLSIR